MRHIIDDPIQKNIELYYAFIQFVSMITLQKISVVETRKDELKNQIKNEGQKNLITYKKRRTGYIPVHLLSNYL
ncbi:DNA mismatch repair protein MutT [Bacillus thuringiensis]|uniref:hypothetical protein n=1 Tax=Bacillus TaxID=1386 RepID=UPI0002DE6536|nr:MULTISPECIES: hypothetical protein [Bacillus cereus group]KAB5654304.1 DNA mismatch repair protein MutT [Bacillus thuringiensis]MED2031997.1 DNA mismatch repair protein MutT [Bacillus thuringiensis]MED2799797.1 DNA mismatch repair protein MutT [Bacillus thuringiensis]PDZ89085.1 DNA mismatch repair protein MutT [Bacillus thuringiensis]TKA07614.1 DNA mismatch repair protein MutT [Bacillus thuringiensis]